MDVKPIRTLQIATALAVIASFTVACTMPSKTATEVAAAASKPFSTGETLQVLHTLGEGEIKQARLAQERSRNERVRDVAELILEDHNAANESIVELAEERGLQLEESPLSEGLEAQADEVYEELSELSGPQFDCRFLQMQIEQHSLAMDTVNSHLLPDAELRETRELLGDVTPNLERHREAARQVIASLPDCEPPRA